MPLMLPGQVAKIMANDEHNLECLTKTGEVIGVWTPARQDFIEKYAELEK